MTGFGTRDPGVSVQAKKPGSLIPDPVARQRDHGGTTPFMRA